MESQLYEDFSIFFSYASMFLALIKFCNSIHYSNPGKPFSMGVTLAKLSAVTIDEEGNETFDTSGALDKLRKVSLLSSLS